MAIAAQALRRSSTFFAESGLSLVESGVDRVRVIRESIRDRAAAKAEEAAQKRESEISGNSLRRAERVAMVRGHPTAYVRIGPEGGPPILAFPPSGKGNLGAYEKNAEFFAGSGFSFVSYDTPGFGHTPLPNHACDDVYYAAHADSFVNAIGINDRMRLIGTSYGGMVALRYAYLHPEKVHSVIVTDCHDGMHIKAQRKPVAAVIAHPRLCKGVVDTSARLKPLFASGLLMYKTRNHLEGSKADVDRTIQYLTSMNPVTYQLIAQYRRQVKEYPRIRRKLAEYGIPVLFIHGASDGIVPYVHSLRGAWEFGGAGYNPEIREGGHSINAEDHMWFNQRAIDFWKTCEQTGRAVQLSFTIPYPGKRD